MRVIGWIVIALLTYALIAFFALVGYRVAHGQIASMGAGCPVTCNFGPPDTGGLADVVASPRLYYGLRSVSIALAGNKAINVCTPSDVACGDLSTNAVTGNLVISPIGGTVCSNVTVCTIKTFYEQSGGMTCSGGTCDMTQAAISARPILVLNCTPNGRPCARFAFASSQFLESIGSATVTAQQISVSSFARTTSANGSIIFAGNSNVAPLVFYGPSTGNTARIFAGTTAFVTASGNTFHAFQAVFSGTNSLIAIDGTSTSNLNANTNPLPAQRMFLGSDNFSDFSDGDFAEFALWGLYSFTGANLTNLNSNQSAYW